MKKLLEQRGPDDAATKGKSDSSPVRSAVEYPSRWFCAYLTEEKRVTFDRIINVDAIGGWKTSGVSQGYGNGYQLLRGVEPVSVRQRRPSFFT